MKKIIKMDSTSFQQFVGEALKITRTAEEHEIILHLMGALAVRYHCPKYGHYHEKMERTPTDIDFASYSKFKDKLTKFLQMTNRNRWGGNHAAGWAQSKSGTPKSRRTAAS